MKFKPALTAWGMTSKAAAWAQDKLCVSRTMSKGKAAQWPPQSEPSLTAGVPAALSWDTAGPSGVAGDVREAGMQENGNSSRDGGDTIEMAPMGVEGTDSGQGHTTRDKEHSTATWTLWETVATASPHHTPALWGQGMTPRPVQSQLVSSTCCLYSYLGLSLHSVLLPISCQKLRGLKIFCKILGLDAPSLTKEPSFLLRSQEFCWVGSVIKAKLAKPLSFVGQTKLNNSCLENKTKMEKELEIQ